MAALVAAIYVLLVALQRRKTWMAGTSPAMTPEGRAFAATAPHRHGRARRGHPRLACGASAKKDVDGRNKSGHDARGKGFRRNRSTSSWPRLSRPSTSCLRRFSEERRGWPEQVRP